MNNDLFTIYKEQSNLIEEVALEDAHLEQVLIKLLNTIHLLMTNIQASILFVDESKTLGNALGPNLPKEFLASLNGIKIGPNAGSCGTAAYYKQMIIVENIHNSPLWENVDKKYIHPFQACWSKPLLNSTKDILGTMAFYCSEKRAPTSKELEVIEVFSNLASIIITIKRAEEKLYISNNVIEKSPAIVMVWKPKKGWPLKFVTNNVSQFGYTKEEFLSGKRDFFSIIHPDDVDRVGLEVQYFSEHSIDEFQQEYRIISKDGTVKFIDDRTVIQRNAADEIEAYQGIILDITDRKDAEEKIKFLAEYDSLTNLPNRKVFMEKLSLFIEQAKSMNSLVAVFFLDIDNFKDANDTMGHDFGDHLLVSVAARLTEQIPKDCFISRISGDEFAFIMSNISQEKDLEQTAYKIMEVFREPLVIDDVAFQITLSIGISLFPTHGDNSGTLMRQADLAMYSAKSRIGKNTFRIFSKQLDEKRLLRKQLIMEMKKALQEDQFTLYYQPQIDIHTNKVYGLEALIRWNHPQKGFVSPGEFIPLAEETGLILEIDRWVLKEACRQISSWAKSGVLNFAVSVNISARQFYSNELVDYVKELIEEMNISPEYLTLEMTEGTLLTDNDKTIKVLKQLSELGVNTALDDFGTGYSSLSYLKYLPINKLKIDRSFLSNVTTDKRDAAVLETIFTLAHHLELDIISEGVETGEQVEYLKGTQCEVAQGFYYSRPICAEEVMPFITHCKKENT